MNAPMKTYAIIAVSVFIGFVIGIASVPIAKKLPTFLRSLKHTMTTKDVDYLMDTSVAVVPYNAKPGTILLDGKIATSLQQAFRDARDFSIIEISPGHYNEAVTLTAHSVKVLADKGAVIYGKATDQKGAMLIKGDNTYIEGLECHSIAVAHNNGVCVRLEGGGITLNNVYFHHAQGGLLGSPKKGDIIINNSRFEALADSAFFHGIYSLKNTRLFIHNSRFLNTRNGGHEIKTRSSHTEITDSIVGSPTSRDSRLVDVSNGGVLILKNNTFIEGNFSENYDLFSWGVEGLEHSVNSINIRENLIISDRGRANFMSVKSPPASFVVKDNIVIGNISGITGDNTHLKDRASVSLPPAPYIPLGAQ